MTKMMFTDKAVNFPHPACADRAARGFEAWREMLAILEDSSLQAFCQSLADQESARAMLGAIFGGSPFLTGCLLKEPAFLHTMMIEGLEESFEALLAEIGDQSVRRLESAALMRLLRIAKRRAALLIAIADIGGLWSVEAVTHALSRFADAALEAATGHLLLTAAQAGEISLADPDEPAKESGLIILGMGKLGAFELNYSSDIDLIVLYDEEKVVYTGRRSVQECFIKLARDLVRIMEERTTEGYVFRTDLRLRPDPGSTPAALSVGAAELYYEGFGQNWERAAMIKARPVAGDKAAGAAFLSFLRPFIWRKHLDFAAIDDIHSIKRQIDSHRGHRAISNLAGHNIKLGRGGIREIEFFAQTQQLIWGGRQAGLRDRSTLVTLARLAEAGHITPQTAEDMSRAYRFLRILEHRLQMIDDRQTQDLPKEESAFEALAIFGGYESADALRDELLAQLRTVEGHYARLFASAPALSAQSAGKIHGNLVFTGSEDDPETLKTIADLGFTQPHTISGQIRGWHHGRVRATRSTRAREMLTELTPALLKALGATSDPDGAFLRFDMFLTRLPAGVPLFSLFHSNPQLLDLVAEIMGDAPRLAEHLARAPSLLDGVLGRGFFAPPRDQKLLAEDLQASLALARDYQEVLDLCRRWVNDRKFQIGVQTVRGLLTPKAIGQALTDIADTVLRALSERVIEDFVKHHGAMMGGDLALVALGKMGSREMTATSDLDLVLIYDVPPEIEESTGPKPLAPSVYYGRLMQRIVAALTAKTGEGMLYEVDMRLRPSGHAGPVASSLEGFLRYQRQSAWTWEHMALTRARVVMATGGLGQRIEKEIRAILSAPRDPVKTLADVADMRARMARELKEDGAWDVKLRRGGLVDIDFIAQYIELVHGHDHPLLHRGDVDQTLLQAAQDGLLAAEDAASLVQAREFFSAIQHGLRQSIEGRFDEDRASAGFKHSLAKLAGCKDFQHLAQNLDETARKVHEIFQTLIERPAQVQTPSNQG